jgi:hypothetical protein
VTGILRFPRRAALTAIAVLVAAASLVSFGESYRGLYDWAGEHGLAHIWAALWPLQVDTFIAVGELTLFVALADQWKTRSRAAAWAVTLAGLAVSVAGNVGHVAGHTATDRGTAAVPPLAAAAALAVGLGVLKRVVGAHPATAPDPTADRTEIASRIAAEVGLLARELRTGLALPASAPEDTARAHPKRTPSAPRARTRNSAAKRPGAHRPGAPDRRTRSAPVTADDAEREFMSELATGALPSIREIRTRLHVGQDRAKELRAHLESLAAVRT